jgi:hypothetical protein
MSGKAAAQEDRSAGVIPAAPWRVEAVTVLPAHRLAVTFRDGRGGVIDCSALLSAAAPGIYAALVDPDFFGRVRIELGVLTWPNGADLDPAWIHEALADRKMWSVPF